MPNNGILYGTVSGDGVRRRGVTPTSAATRSGSLTNGSATSCEDIPEMESQLRRFAETLADPDTVQSLPGPARRSGSITGCTRTCERRNRYICIVVKREADYSFILTAYLDRRIKGGSA